MVQGTPNGIGVGTAVCPKQHVFPDSWVMLDVVMVVESPPQLPGTVRNHPSASSPLLAASVVEFYLTPVEHMLDDVRL